MAHADGRPTTPLLYLSPAMTPDHEPEPLPLSTLTPTSLAALATP